MDILEIRDVSFQYGRHRVLDRVSLRLGRGEFACVTGANGSGKSTLLRLILGKLALQSGRIRILSQEQSKFRDWPKLGYIPQSLGTLTGGFPATAAEITATGLYSKIGPLRFPNKRHRQLVIDALRRVGMDAYAKEPVGALSGGQQQRVMLARMLAGEPELMLLDEPSSGADPENADALYRLLADLCANKGLTALMVTHDVERCLRYADRIFCLEDGNMAELGKGQLAHELSHRHRHSPYSECRDLNRCECENRGDDGGEAR